MTALTLYSFPCKKSVKITGKPMIKHRTTKKGRTLGLLCGNTDGCGRVCRMLTNEKATAAAAKSAVKKAKLALKKAAAAKKAADKKRAANARR
jgi:hypothetical protein